MKALLDTNILIDYLNGIPQAKHEIDSYPKPLISIITWVEVLVGATPEDEATIRGFLSRFQVIALTAVIAENAVLIRRQSKIRLPDAIIQATAQVEKVLLVSRNTKDFPENAQWVRIPYKLHPDKIH
ncbi:MAG: type II toxin-antitoxin system VapC family toxin [Thiofilum sp.]|uniref:type II toxin-antitoxin system VapC family toxin n=1 Tax=Thiofilum sp. TaxID=2212733 RepID=UPI0025EBF538|nr:type II toxin-antitoxin system VapC family toxin [Thiofilum sp.]MBK8454122.1 type II toxin-antitoxin system VapC family toxin [Thiofilum sp.]